MGTVLPIAPTVVRAFTRSGVDLGLARLPWPNVEPGDVLLLDSDEAAEVVAVLYAPAATGVGAFVKVAYLDDVAPA